MITMAAAEIVQLFPSRANLTASSAVSSEQTQSVGITPSIADEIPVPRGRTALTIDDLYGELDTQESILESALRLLIEGESKLIEGQVAAAGGDQVLADDATQHFQALLPELFCCRSLGDSFATVINALFHGLKNLNGFPIAEAQIAQMLNSIRVLRRRPFLEYGEALALVSRLEATGLRVDPQGLGTIEEVLLG
jgi:hypothetical protein